MPAGGIPVFTDWPTIPMCIDGLVQDYRCTRERASQLLASYARDRAGPIGSRSEPDEPVRIVELAGQEIDAIDWLTGTRSAPAWSLKIENLVLECPSPVLFINSPALRGYAERHLAQPRQVAKAGRPPKYDWTAGAVEVARWVFHRGIPDPLAPLVAHLQLSMAGPDGEGPDERDVRRWLAPVLNRIASSYEGEK